MKMLLFHCDLDIFWFWTVSRKEHLKIFTIVCYFFID